MALDLLVVDDGAVAAHGLDAGLAEEVERLHLVLGAVLDVALARVLDEGKQLGDGVVVGQPSQLGLRGDESVTARRALDLDGHGHAAEG